MRARNLKPGFFQNDELSDLMPLARILFAGLWCFADREGRFEWKPKKIKALILPYDKCNVMSLLDALAQKNFILRYEIDGNDYGWIPTFLEHQSPHPNEKKSTIPLCPEKITTNSSPDPCEYIPSLPILKQFVYERDGKQCAFCGSVNDLQIDHKISTRYGGKNEMANLQVLCRSCNLLKRKWEEDGKSLEEMKNMAKTYQKIKFQEISGNVNVPYISMNRDSKKRDSEKGGSGGKEKIEDEKIKYAEFVSLTEEEHRKLIEKYGDRMTEQIIEKLNNAKGAKGYTYKSDYYAVFTWVAPAVFEDMEKEGADFKGVESEAFKQYQAKKKKKEDGHK